ncbi:MAG: GxxExxY protein [Chloroflexi bacterium]|nr:GxxExxY protein [Chloroflexota bacterium]
MAEIILKEEAYAIIGAAMEVYNELGPGFLEAVYQEAMEIELGLRGIPFSSQQELVIYYKKRPLKKRYVPDLFCYDKIVVDLKATERLVPNDHAQLHNYLNGTKHPLGILINFGMRDNLEYKRIAYTESQVGRRPRYSPRI